MYTKNILIVAGGSGTRMGASIPKQFLVLEGKPILAHTLEKFQEYAPNIYLVLPKNNIRQWQEILTQYAIITPHTIVEGGNTRQQSVQNGLQAIPNTHHTISYIAIHDAVRPFLTAQFIQHCFQEAILHGNAVPSIASKDSTRLLLPDNTSKIIDRNQVQLVQTPQIFLLEEIKKAHTLLTPALLQYITDDASVYESTLQKKIHLIEGESCNIKITYPSDLPSNVPSSPPRIVYTCAAVVRRGQEILVQEKYDMLQKQIFYHLITTEIQFGHKATESITVEVKKQINADFSSTNVPIIVEKFLDEETKPCHEIITLYEGKINPRFYELDTFSFIKEKNIKAIWINPITNQQKLRCSTPILDYILMV